MATIRKYTITEDRWDVVCGCPTSIGKIACKSVKEVEQMLEHHERQVEHVEWAKTHTPKGET